MALLSRVLELRVGKAEKAPESGVLIELQEFPGFD